MIFTLLLIYDYLTFNYSKSNYDNFLYLISAERYQSIQLYNFGLPTGVWLFCVMAINLHCQLDLESVCHQQGGSAFFSRLWLTEHSSGLAVARQGLEAQVTWFLVGLCTHYLCFLISKLGKCTQSATQAQRVCVSMQHIQQLAQSLAHKDTLNHQSSCYPRMRRKGT